MNAASQNEEEMQNQRGLHQQSRVWFSTYFGLDITQFELPFVDFDLNADVPLYIDPYAITKDPTDLGARCHNSIVSFYQTLLNAIRSGNRHLMVHPLSVVYNWKTPQLRRFPV